MNTPFQEPLALHAHAKALERQETGLPDGSPPFKLPDAAALGRQLSELGRFITEMGDEFLFRATEQPVSEHAVLAAGAYAQAYGHAGQAASDLGMVAQQLAFFARTAEQRHNPEVRQARKDAAEVIGWAVGTARDELQQAAQTLRQTATLISPPSVDLRQKAALSRPSLPHLGVSRTAATQQPAPIASAPLPRSASARR